MPATTLPVLRFRQAGANEAQLAALQVAFDSKTASEQDAYVEYLASVDRAQLHTIIAALDEPGSPTAETVDLESKKRAELDEYAAVLGVADPESYNTKADLIVAIREVEAQPPVESEGATEPDAGVPQE